MADTPSTLRGRIEAVMTKRAALEERRSRASADLADAEKNLRTLGLNPKTARETIEAAEAALEADIEKMETALDL